MTNPHEMIELFRLLADPGYPFELRALCGGRDSAGWYDCDHIPQAVSTALSLNEKRDRDGTGYQFSGIYFTLNPVKPELLSRRSNRVALAQRGFPLTADSDIAYRRWLLIDVDPVRAAGISATDDEKRQAMTTGKPVLSYLKECGWPDPLILDSGNGFHLLYRIDLPNDDQSRLIVKDCLRSLASMFDTDSAKVDTSVFNAARICKFYGTISRKGDSTADRPWRRSRAAIIPASVEIVSVDKLNQLAELAPKGERKQSQGGVKPGRRGGSSLPVDEQARKYLAVMDPAIEGQGGSKAAFRAACALVQGFGMTPDDALPLFRGYNERCVPPWSEDALMHKLQDADKRSGDRGYLLSQKRESARPMHISEFDNEFEPLTDDSLDGLPSALDGLPAEADPLAGIGIDSSDTEAAVEVDTIPSGWGVTAELPTASVDDAHKEDPVTPKPIHKPEPIRNYVESHSHTSGKEKTVKNPMPIEAIVRNILRQVDLKRVRESIFAPRFDGIGVMYLESTDSLFSHIGEKTGFPPQFVNSTQEVQYHTKGEVFQQLKRTAEEFDAVETLPHEPPLVRHYYACKAFRPGNGDRLRELVNFFCADSDIDRDLILAAFVTPFWGGPNGSRPAFCITGDGRGSGKTTLANLIADLSGGAINVAANEDYQRVATRALSRLGRDCRGILVDNLKTDKLSSSGLESLITAKMISGHDLFNGEGTRPNTLTVFITVNGPSLSKDMAQRSVIIKLRRPEYSGKWEEDVNEFVDRHREEIIADIIGFLRGPAVDLTGFNRFGAWQRAVVARLPEPKEAMAVIRERSASVDADHEEAELVEDYFAKMLSGAGYDPSREKVFIPTAIASEWFDKATGYHLGAYKASARIKQKCHESEFRRIFLVPGRKHGRGYEWTGEDAEGDTVRRDLEHQIEINKSNRFI